MDRVRAYAHSRINLRRRLSRLALYASLDSAAWLEEEVKIRLNCDVYSNDREF